MRAACAYLLASTLPLTAACSDFTPQVGPPSACLDVEGGLTYAGIRPLAVVPGGSWEGGCAEYVDAQADGAPDAKAAGKWDGGREDAGAKD
jgi:hypothetical protein